MKAAYNVTGADRKALVKAIENIIGEKAVYKKAPTFEFAVGAFTVDRNGTVSCDDGDALERMVHNLIADGFRPEGTPVEAPDEEGSTGLTIEIPLDKVNVGNLKKILEAKGRIIKKALAADRITFDTNADRVSFPWWDRQPGSEETQSYMAFLAALCKMTKEAKRITAKETEVESEKYAFRCFLLRLGFIGNDCKPQRKILMSRLSGSAAFSNKEKADAFNATLKAKAAAAKEVHS